MAWRSDSFAGCPMGMTSPLATALLDSALDKGAGLVFELDSLFLCLICCNNKVITARPDVT
jgi:hypothetical protein